MVLMQTQWGDVMKHLQLSFSKLRSKWLLSTCLIGAATVISILTPTSAFAAQDCASLANLKINDTNLLSAIEVPASGDLPAYCRVLGYVRPAINFEIRLPLQQWNGKFYMAGCGGFCGTLDSDRPGFTNAMNFGLRPDTGRGRRGRKHVWRAGQFARTTALSRRRSAWFRAVLATLGHRQEYGADLYGPGVTGLLPLPGFPTASRPCLQVDGL
jgi:hypothetical protein